MQQEFINIAAHKLRTPSQSILGYAELEVRSSIYGNDRTFYNMQNYIRLKY